MVYHSMMLLMILDYFINIYSKKKTYQHKSDGDRAHFQFFTPPLKIGFCHFQSLGSQGEKSYTTRAHELATCCFSPKFDQFQGLQGSSSGSWRPATLMIALSVNFSLYWKFNLGILRLIWELCNQAFIKHHDFHSKTTGFFLQPLFLII